ncbi:pimeloyl-ACP methyl ester carboxylesterase [Mumia flava]|uniref:Pimeloyl-ACP methyl ester carboxylesterase n=1 Tax=Mumia flava TaxID=1348852 RepID=A0A0B2B0C8_9ACTN|nr:alpha/beta fold hydrolase [Mumia flava]PJJ56661.1 pimeloyl-ACP methyl ester carboxylesterase [Mumia flava]
MSTPRTLETPAGVTARTVPTDRGAFALHEAAVPDGVTHRGHLLLIPGFTGSKEDFTPILPLLAAAGWHTCAYDQRGQFETPGDGAAYGLDDFAEDALALREALWPYGPSAVVGHSFGGLVAQRAVLLDASAWLGLTLLCSGPGGFTLPGVAEHAVDLEARPKELRLFLQAVPVVGLKAVFDVQNADSTEPAEILAFLERRFLASDASSLCAIAEHLLDAEDRIDALAATGVPVAVVRGADDDAWPHASQDAMAARLRTTVVVVPDAAHSPAVENPAATVAALLG